MNSYGALKITGNTTASIAGAAAAVHTQGWAAHGVSQQGNATVTPVAASGKLTLLPGVYLIEAVLVVETEDISGTSGDGVGVITCQLYQAAAAVGGAKAKLDAQAVDRPQTIKIMDIVEITAAQQTAGTNYVDLRFSSGDASGNDITVTDGVFCAVKLD